MPRLTAVSSPLSRALKSQRRSTKQTLAQRTTAHILPTSPQSVPPRSPKVQNTRVDSCTSSAKYWRRVVAPVNMELMATPARTIPSGETCRNRLSPRITRATAMLPAKAHRGIATLPRPPADPICSTMIAKAAPKLAPWDTPRVEAEARGLRRMAWSTQPEIPRPPPAMRAVQMRGRRLLRTIRLILSSEALPNTARTSSPMGV